MAGRTQAGHYDLSAPSLILGTGPSGLFGPLLLRDEASATELERHFNDLYHLFLNRFARLSHDPALSDRAAAELTALLADLLAVKRKLADQPEK